MRARRCHGNRHSISMPGVERSRWDTSGGGGRLRSVTRLDLAVLDRDILSAGTDIARAQSHVTWVDGKIAFSDGRSAFEDIERSGRLPIETNMLSILEIRLSKEIDMNKPLPNNAFFDRTKSPQGSTASGALQECGGSAPASPSEDVLPARERSKTTIRLTIRYSAGVVGHSRRYRSGLRVRPKTRSRSGRTSREKRRALPHTIADKIEARADEIALVESTDSGQAIRYMSKAALRRAELSASMLTRRRRPQTGSRCRRKLI